jgi:hypothetical protein
VSEGVLFVFILAPYMLRPLLKKFDNRNGRIKDFAPASNPALDPFPLRVKIRRVARAQEPPCKPFKFFPRHIRAPPRLRHVLETNSLLHKETSCATKIVICDLQVKFNADRKTPRRCAFATFLGKKWRYLKPNKEEGN